MNTYNVSFNLNDKGDFRLQIFVASCMSISVSLLLKPIGMPRVLSQIIAGIILGPSVLGRIPGFQTTVFPCKGFTGNLEVYSILGLMFHMLLVGVQMKPSMTLQPGRPGLVIGISMLVLPAIASVVLAFLVSKIAGLTPTETKTLELVGVLESWSTFSIVTYYLHELKIINCKFSRVAYSASLVSNMLGIVSAITILILGLLKKKGIEGVVFKFYRYVLLLIIVVFVLKPLNRRMERQTLEGQPLRQTHLCVAIAVMMCLTLYCIVFHINPLCGPFVYGLTIPTGTRMGTNLLRRLEPFTVWVLMPVFYTKVGNEIDIFSPMSAKALLVVCVVLCSYAAKILGAYLPARFFDMSYKEAILLGLAVNAQGFFELLVFTSLYHRKHIDKDSYAIIVMSIVILTGASTPIIRNLYKSTVENEGSSINTIQHAQPHDRFRVIACVHSEEIVPSLIHLLKASNPSKYSPINVSIVHLINLAGIQTPIFINHKSNEDDAHIPASSQRIMKAFTNYEDNNPGTMFVYPYTVVTPYTTMHTDLYALALQKRPYLIIIPFHKQLSTGEVNAGLRTVSNKVLDYAPCSVGILIDRGLLTTATFDPESSFRCNVAVVFLEGADDREALAYAARMCGQQNIELSVFRFLKNSSERSQMRESILDDKMLTGFKHKTADNPRVAYIEEEVNDGIAVIQVIKAMQNNFDLILVGRQHDVSSPLIQELTEWDCSELGTMGDIFVNSSYGGKATILVLQQQRRAATRLASRTKDKRVSSRNYTVLK